MPGFPRPTPAVVILPGWAPTLLDPRPPIAWFHFWPRPAVKYDARLSFLVSSLFFGVAIRPFSAQPADMDLDSSGDLQSAPPARSPQTSPALSPRVNSLLRWRLPWQPINAEKGPTEPTSSATGSASRSNNKMGTSGLSAGHEEIAPQHTHADEPWAWSRKRLMPSRFLSLAGILLVAVSFLYGASALSIPGSSNVRRIAPRENTNPDVCSRWSQQSALVNGTLYVYGGHATTEQGQSSNTWNNDFFTVDVTKSWDISKPVVQGLPQPSGPPPVSNGYLWNSETSLFLYGGEFSDNPNTSPVAFSLWEYDIASSSWTEHQNPKTSAGDNSEPANQPVQRSAEGAGVSVPGLGRGYYFAGHLDEHTTVGWSNQIYRQYLKSLLEFTFPGSKNDGVENLGGDKTAGNDGAWRNITQGGIQDTALFPNRADSALVYVPGYGDQGILVSMGGGTNVSFVRKVCPQRPVEHLLIIPQTQMNVIDIFDIASSTWYRQSTSGAYPTLRVNPCAVAASAADGSSTNIYLYGGQNLIPYMNQTQFGDMWILTIPSFTWIQVDTTGQSVPLPRVGHTCNMWDGQMVVIGGYNTDLAGGCDSGFYVFDASNLKWQNTFNAISGGNPLNQQSAQASDSGALGGSYGYQVPLAVQSVIGGKGSGGATITAPAQSATAGPLATGKPITYTVTESNGAVVTETGTVTSTTPAAKSSGPNVGAIVAGVVAGMFAVLAAYLGFCTWVYRRQLALYKNHVAMTQRAAVGAPGEKTAFLGESSLDDSRNKSTDRSSGQAGSTEGGSNRYTGGSAAPLGPTTSLGVNSIANSSTEELVGEPTFFGVLLNPRRSLRVVNRD